MACRKDVFSNLKSRFESWLQEHGVASAYNHYINQLEAIGMPIAPHTAVGAMWCGFYEVLTGKRPMRGVFAVSGLEDFLENYGEAAPLLTAKQADKESLRPLYRSCLDYDTVFAFARSTSQSGDGDGGHTRCGYTKYLQFLAELESNVDPLVSVAGLCEPRQSIVYGAPGTGKSFGMDDDLSGTDGKSKAICIRTTFHPDSDYSTFVGAYKPTKEDSRITYNFRPQAFMNAYVAAWKEAAKGEGGKTRTDNVKKPYTGLNAVMVNVVNAFIAEGGKGVEKSRKDIIAKAIELSGGEFGEQSFVPSDYCYNRVNGAMTLTRPALFEFLGDGKYKCLGAEDLTYTGDIFWREKGSDVDELVGKCTAGVRKLAADEPSKPVVLVIEEINRGNCAQIFGDLFQLLDRNESGYSTYPICADVDLAKWLSEDQQFGEGLDGLERPRCIRAEDWDDVLKGRKLALPPTLYIWATMNTSDQSLFPMDSAFKRRWEWKYVPIAKPDEPNWKDRKIKVGSSLYDWWDFLTIVNKHIAKATESEDKQLGYFFVKAPDDTGLITADQFANKVLFYLYGDVFKSYELPAAAFKREGGAVWAFRDFFYPETVVVLKADGQLVKDGNGNIAKTVTDETTQALKKPGDVNEFELAAFLDHLKWKDEKGEKTVGKSSIAGADA